MSAAEKLAEVDATLIEVQVERDQLYGEMTDLRLRAQSRTGTTEEREQLAEARKRHREADGRCRDLQRLKDELTAQVQRERQAAEGSRQAAVNAMKVKARTYATKALAVEESALVRACVRLVVLNELAIGGRPSEASPEQLPAVTRHLFRAHVQAVLEEVIDAAQ